MTEPILEISNLSKQYRLGYVGTGSLGHDINRWWQTSILGKEDPYLKIGEENNRTIVGNSEYVWALRDINLQVQQGEVLGIIGANGAGKSTLLKILSRVTGPTTGSIVSRGRIASLLEVGTGFHGELTGRENIYLNGAILGMTKKEISLKLDEIVAFSGCERYIDTPVKRYSSGMYVRLAFAVAAHLEPEILIVDEVLAVGDAEFQKKAIGKMKDVSSGEGRTVLFVSHNMTTIKSICSRGLYLKNGKIEVNGSVQDALNAYLLLEGAVKTKADWTVGRLPGDEDAQLIKARLIDKNTQDIISVEINQCFGIEFIYKVLINRNTKIPNMHLYSSKGECVFASAEKDSILLKEAGVYKTIIWIPENLLNVDTYFVELTVTTMSPFKVHLSVKDALVFETQESLQNRNNLYNQKMDGVVRPILNWETVKIS